MNCPRAAGKLGRPGGATRIVTLRLGFRLALVGLLACGAPPSARAQVMDDVVEAEGGQDTDVQDLEQEQRLKRQALQRPDRYAAVDSFIATQVFGNTRTALTAHSRLETLTRLKLEEVDRCARLSEAQKKKLELAARGDVKRFFDRLEETRKALRSVFDNPQNPDNSSQMIRPLRLTFYRGLFVDDSLFTKTLKKTLDDRQVTALDDLSRRRSLLRQQARIGRVLESLDQYVALEIDQRKQLLKMIVEHTHPSDVPGRPGVDVVLYQFAQLPRDQIRPIFHERQWEMMNQQLDRILTCKEVLLDDGVLPLGPEPERWAVSIDSDASPGTRNQVEGN